MNPIKPPKQCPHCQTVNQLDRKDNGTLLQYSCLENPMDGGAWWAAVHGVAKSWTRLSNFPFTFHFHALEKEIQCSCLENPSDVGAWWAVVYGVAQSRTRLKRLSKGKEKHSEPSNLALNKLLDRSVCFSIFSVRSKWYNLYRELHSSTQYWGLYK